MSLKQAVKMKNCRDMYSGIIEFKKGYQSNLAKDEKELHVDFHGILNRQKN